MRAIFCVHIDFAVQSCTITDVMYTILDKREVTEVTSFSISIRSTFIKEIWRYVIVIFD